MLEILGWHPNFDEIDRVHFGLIEEDETVKTLDKTGEKSSSVVEVTPWI